MVAVTTSRKESLSLISDTRPYADGQTVERFSQVGSDARGDSVSDWNSDVVSVQSARKEQVMPENLLYCGDNVAILRRHIKDESVVDLVYLDPPIKSVQ